MPRSQSNQNYLTRVSKAESVTAHDTNVQRFDALYIGTGGNLVVRLRDDDANVTFNNISNGTFLPICTKIILSTNTTCSNILGLYID